MEAIAIQKNAGPVQVLQGTGAGTGVLNAEQINAAVKFDRFPDSCSECGSPLSHEDLIGKFHGTIFKVKGYICPTCGHKVGKIHQKNFRTSTVRFNWKRLDTARTGTTTAGRVPE